MALMTCAVRCVVHDEAGQPVEGARISATLNRHEVYDGYVVPTLVEGMTDAAGEAVLALWPNQLGATESLYVVRIALPSGQKLSVNAVVPNVASAYLHQIAQVPVYPGKTDGQLMLDAAVAAVAPAVDAMLAAQAAQATAGLAQAGAELAQSLAEGAERQAEAFALEAAGSAQAAASDRLQVAEDRVQTGLDRQATAADRVQTGLDATATLGNATAADLSRLAAKAHAEAAAVSAGIAGDKAAEAAASAGSFAEHFASMATSLIQTQAIVVAHHAFQ